jgi:hypothetical protein
MTRRIHFVSYLRRELTVVAGISLEKEAVMLCSWRSINGDDNGQAALAKAQRGAVGDGQSSLADVAAWDGTDGDSRRTGTAPRKATAGGASVRADAARPMAARAPVCRGRDGEGQRRGKASMRANTG